MMIPNSNNSSKSNTPLSKQDDFLNIFEFNNNTTSANDNINGNGGDATNNKPLVKKENSNDDKYLMSHISSNNNLSFAASSDNFNDLNKLLSNTVGNSEYLDMPLPLIFNDNSNKFTSEYQTNNDDFDSHSLLSYTTNNSSMTNNTMTNSISNIGRGRKYSRLGSVKSFRSTAADSIDDEVIKERKKKIHNNVEKKRRELIKNKIQEINELLPLSVIKIVNANYINENIIRTGRPKSELVDPFSIGNKDIKVRKRDILCGSLLYINFLNKIIEKVNKRTDQFDNLYEALLKRKNSGSNNAIKIPKSSVTNENKQTNSTNIKEQSLVYMNNEENKRSSNLSNNNYGDSQYTMNSHENIHDLDDFAKFLKSINDVPSQTVSTSDIQNSNSINNNNSNNYDTYDNLLNMPVFSDDTLKNLLLQNNNNDNNGGNSENNYNDNNNNNQKDSSTNLNDPFNNWINM